MPSRGLQVLFSIFTYDIFVNVSSRCLVSSCLLGDSVDKILVNLFLSTNNSLVVNHPPNLIYTQYST